MTEGSVDLERLPETVDIGQRVLVEVAVGAAVVCIAERADVGVEDGHRVLAHVVDILRVVIHEPVRRGVVDILGVGHGGLAAEHEVDEALGQLLIPAACRDAHGVNEVVRVFGVVKLQIHAVGLCVAHREVVACVVGGHGGLAGLHHVVDLIHDVALDERALVDECLQCLLPVGVVGRVDVDAGAVHGRAERVARVVELQDVAGVFRVPHQIPAAGVGLVHDIGVVDHAHDAVGVRNGVGVVGVIVQAAEVLGDILIVRDVVVVERQEHVLGFHARDHVVRRDDHVVAHGAALELGIHVLVAGVGVIVDLDGHAVGRLVPVLERGDGVERIVRAVGDIFAPVVDVEHARLLPAAVDADAGDEQRGGGKDAHGGAHGAAAAAAALGAGGLARALGTAGVADALRVVLVDEVRQQQQRENDEEDDRRQGVHFRRDGLFRHVVDADRKRLEAAALREVADDEVIEREREGHDHAGDDAGQDLRHFHAEKRTHRRAAEIHRGLGQRAVHLLQLRQHLHDDIRQAERDVRREHRPEAETRGRAEQPAEEHEHEHQRNAGDDVRIHHGDVGRRVERGAQIFVAHPVHAHGGSRAHRGRHERCDHGEDERVFERVERFPVAEQLLIPF